jgi:phosphate transport system protein
MAKTLNREIEKLKRQILSLGAIVEDRVNQAVKALQERNAKLAQWVIDGDPEIDQMEVDLEEECLKILALHQPVAIDLRFIIAVLKINNELERIGDLAVDIAERAAFLATQKPIESPIDFAIMCEKTISMLKKSLDSLVNRDATIALEVCATDDAVDAINRQMYRKIEENILKYPEQIDAYIHLLSSSRHLERIADHATNIAEDVIYMITGDIVRHCAEDYAHPIKT